MHSSVDTRSWGPVKLQITKGYQREALKDVFGDTGDLDWARNISNSIFSTPMSTKIWYYLVE